MPRPSGYNSTTTADLLRVLVKAPDGLWIRRLAKQADLHPSTVSRYLAGPLKPFVDTSPLGSPNSKPLLVVVRLKSVVLQRLEEGASLADVIRLLSLMEEAKK